jgi:hypothetical protein
MKTLYLRNVPDDVAAALDDLAKRESMSVSARRGAQGGHGLPGKRRPPLTQPDSKCTWTMSSSRTRWPRPLIVATPRRPSPPAGQASARDALLGTA